MSTMIIKRGDGPEVVVDCAPIEAYESEMREAIARRDFACVPIERLLTMDREQLMHLASILTMMTLEYARLYDSAFSPEHEKLVQGLRELKQAADDAGVELWGDWPELGRGKSER